jgi:hypothetical protein
VNTSQAFREGVQKLGGGRIEIMYVPAGGTGRYQVNDTHMHKPMKWHAQVAAGRWYAANVMILNKQRWPTPTARGHECRKNSMHQASGTL